LSSSILNPLANAPPKANGTVPITVMAIYRLPLSFVPRSPRRLLSPANPKALKNPFIMVIQVLLVGFVYLSGFGFRY
ncbi:TPA: hypothetical protein ACNVV3_002747, partial [Pseudomonas putida]